MAGTIEIARHHELPVAELVAGGALLAAGDRKLFLPAHLLPDGVGIGDAVKVFVYADREGEPQATTWVPAALLGEFAYLKCVSVTRAGAYLDWGVPKDLYVPPAEQTTRMVEGRRYVVVVCLDKKGERQMGSAQLTRHFDYDVSDVEVDDEVDLLVYGRTVAGVQVVVDQRHRGLVHHADAHRRLPVGTELRGYVRRIRDDNRLDIALTRRGVGGIEDAEQVILDALVREGGSLALHDRSSPREIERVLGMSKKAFKRGAGGLYRAKKIVIDEDGITLVKAAAEPGDTP